MRPFAPDIEKANAVTTSSRRALIGPIAANIAFVTELTLVPLLLPAIQSYFDLSLSNLVWVFNSYGIAVAVGVLLGGWFGDACDTRKVFGFGVALFAAGSLVAAVAESFEVLVIGRMLQGLGGGIFSPLVPLLLTRASPLKPGRALIFWGSMAGYIAALAPLLYGGFLGQQSWNLAFFFVAVTALIALVTQCVTNATSDATPHSRLMKNYAALFRARDLWVTFVYVFCTYGSITYYLFQLPVRLSNNEVTAASAGFVLSVMWLTFSGLSALLRNMVDSHYIRPIMLVAPLLIAIGVPLSYFTESPLLLVMSSVLVGSGLACSNAPSTQLILRFAPSGMSGISTSLDITFARLGGIATVVILAEKAMVFAASVTGLLCLTAAICALATSKGLAKSD